MLRDGSAIGAETIATRGYRTITDAAELLELGFSSAQARPRGLLLPLWSTAGEVCGAVFRPDNPRVREIKTTGPLPDGTFPCKVLKYEFPQGAPMRVDCPPACQPARSVVLQRSSAFR